MSPEDIRLGLIYSTSAPHRDVRLSARFPLPKPASPVPWWSGKVPAANMNTTWWIAIRPLAHTPVAMSAPRIRRFTLRICKQARPKIEEHTSELQSRENLVCRLLLEKKKKNVKNKYII